MSEAIRFSAEVETVFIEEGFDPAYFVTLPGEAAALVTEHRLATGKRGGFGSIRASVRIGESKWETTLNVKDSVWTLPIKKPIRLAEGLEQGAVIDLAMTLS